MDSYVCAELDCKVADRPQWAKVIYRQRSKAIQWLWKLSLKNYEAVYGMSRVALLVPDKVATALEINQDKSLSGSEEDGSFLIQLVVQLANKYLEQAKQFQGQEENSEEENTIFNFGVEQEATKQENLDFYQVLEHFVHTLENLTEALKSRNLEEIR